MQPFEPDRRLQEKLRTEHHSGTLVVKELMSIAHMFLNQGGTYDDYLRLVQASYFWASFEGSTSTPARKHPQFLEDAWCKAEASHDPDYDNDTVLTALAGRIETARWTGRNGSRNRCVALAFVRFCYEHNCYVRTISTYELAKWTDGMSHVTVSRALHDLVGLGLLSRVDRTDFKETARSTRRYELNRYWRPTGDMRPPTVETGSGVDETRNYGINSLFQVRHSPADVWSARGLGESARRVYDVLNDTPTTVRELACRAGVTRDACRHALAKLFDRSLAGQIAGRPSKYFRVDTPLDAVAEAMSVSGYVEFRRQQLEARQAANRTGYPASYAQAQEQPVAVITAWESSPHRRRWSETRRKAFDAKRTGGTDALAGSGALQ